MIGGDIIEKVRRAVASAKYDDAVVVARVEGRPGSSGSYHAIERVTYDGYNNMIVVTVGHEGVPYEAIREGWRPAAS